MGVEITNHFTMFGLSVNNSVAKCANCGEIRAGGDGKFLVVKGNASYLSGKICRSCCRVRFTDSNLHHQTASVGDKVILSSCRIGETSNIEYSTLGSYTVGVCTLVGSSSKFDLITVNRNCKWKSDLIRCCGLRSTY